MGVTDELKHFENYFDDLTDQTLIDNLKKRIYEQVQYTEELLQRLYLMVLTGTWLAKIGYNKFHDVFQDLIEMSGAIQSSQRGLFLRYYILQKIRYFIQNEEKFSTISTEDLVNITIENFTEMNKLWVQMQFQGHTRQKEQRSLERQHLRVLVGKTLTTLSELHETRFSDEVYDQILNKIGEQAIHSKDTTAQDYLFECMIQVYDDKYHLMSQREYMILLSKVNRDAKLNSILTEFVKRIQEQSILELDNQPPGYLEDSVRKISYLVRDLIVDRLDFISRSDIITLQDTILSFAKRIYALENNPVELDDHKQIIDEILKTTAQLISMHIDYSESKDNDDQKADLIFDETSEIKKSVAKFGSDFASNLIAFLQKILNIYNDIHIVLGLKYFVTAYEMLECKARKEFSRLLIENIVTCKTFISDVEQADTILSLCIEPLMNSAGTSNVGPVVTSIEDQSFIGKLMNLLKSDNVEQQYEILQKVKFHLERNESNRLGYAIPSLVYNSLELIDMMTQSESSCELDVDKIWNDLVTPSIQSLYDINTGETVFAELALRLFLHSALYCDRLLKNKGSAQTYQFFSDALEIYEEVLPDSKTQAQAIPILVGTLEKIENLSNENHEPLRSHLFQLAGRLFRKPDQVEALLNISHVSLYLFL